MGLGSIRAEQLKIEKEQLTVIFAFFTFIRRRKQSTLFIIIMITEIAFTSSIVSQINSLSSLFGSVVTRSVSKICAKDQDRALLYMSVTLSVYVPCQSFFNFYNLTGRQ